MNLQDAHEVLGWFLAGNSESENEVLAMMLLLHTHRIQFTRPVLDDRPDVCGISAITQRHAAETAAKVWGGGSDEGRDDPAYWYFLLNTNAPYEVVEDMPEHWRAEVEKMRVKLLAHPDVSAVEKED